MTAANSGRRRSSRTRVLVVGDVPADLVSQLTLGDLSVVGRAANAAEATREAAKEHPDVVLVGLDLVNGRGESVCAALRDAVPEAAIVVLPASRGEDVARTPFDAGANAFLLEDSDQLDLAAAIRRAIGRATVVDDTAAAPRLRSVEARGEAKVAKLSEQELKILRLAAQGLSNREIGARLYLSRHTVKEYLSNAMRKLGVTTRIEAVLKASRHGLLERRAGSADDVRSPVAVGDEGHRRRASGGLAPRQRRR